MIVQRFYLSKYDWKVVVLYEVDDSNTNYVIGVLRSICNDKNIIRQARESVSNGKLNTGFTYSDNDNRLSLVCIGKTSSNRELVNTIVHEANHLQSHIATTYGLDRKGEEVCYLMGSIVETMYRVFNKIICP